LGKTKAPPLSVFWARLTVWPRSSVPVRVIGTPAMPFSPKST
jgi:hypothetical protein